MTRANARELAVHLIYGREFTGEEPEQVVTTRLQKEYYEKLAAENEVYSDRPSSKQLRYIDTVVSGVANREEELNAKIQNYSVSWDISRISKLTRCVMQLAIYEILYVEDVPTGVAISEAVRLAKKYDGDDTGAFVNGILGAFGRSLNAPVPVAEETAE
jgi:N utilization substance protein B